MQIRPVSLLVLTSALLLVVGAPAQDLTWTLHGTVIDSVTEKPISGATVYLDRDPPQKGPAWQPRQDKDGRETITDSNGKFVFDRLSGEDHLLYVAKAGYISATGNFPTFSSYVVQPDPWHPRSTFLLTPAATIAGRVTAGRP
ncbi:MAG TPA: carboxypeptidase-like regulatory domain-containing protein [Terracidiphilus sp.]|jgi:hypothetical protein